MQVRAVHAAYCDIGAGPSLRAIEVEACNILLTCRDSSPVGERKTPNISVATLGDT